VGPEGGMTRHSVGRSEICFRCQKGEDRLGTEEWVSMEKKKNNTKKKNRVSRSSPCAGCCLRRMRKMVYGGGIEYNPKGACNS